MLPDLRNPLSLPETDLNWLAQAVQPAAELDPKLPTRLLRYGVDGNGDRAAIAQLLVWLYNHPQAHTLSHQLFDEQWCRPLQSDAITALWFDYLQQGQVWRQQFMQQASIDAVTGQIRLPALKTFLPQFIAAVSPFCKLRAAAKRISPFAADIVDALYVETGEAPGSLARLIYLDVDEPWLPRSVASHAVHLRWFAHYTVNHADIVRQGLQQRDRAKRLHTLNMLGASGATPEPWLTEIVAAAVSSARTEQMAALPLLEQARSAAIPQLQAIAESGSSQQRQEAIKVLQQLAGETVQPFLAQRLTEETTAGVRTVLAEQLQPVTAKQAEAATSSPSPMADMELTPVVPDAASPHLDAIATIMRQSRRAHQSTCWRRLKQLYQAEPTTRNLCVRGIDGNFRFRDFAPADQAAIAQLLNDLIASAAAEEQVAQQRFQALWAQQYGADASGTQLSTLIQQGTYDQCRQQVDSHHFYLHLLPQASRDALQQALQALLALPQWSLAQAMRLLMLVGHLKERASVWACLTQAGHALLRGYRQQHPDSGGLREFAVVLDAVGLQPDLIEREMLDYLSSGDGGFWQWEDDAIWPYFAERSHDVYPKFEQALADRSPKRHPSELRQQVLRALSTFPQLPEPFTSTVWQTALTGPQAERSLARASFNQSAPTPNRLFAALADKRCEVRMGAAAWLGDRGDPAAIEPLKQALQTEKSEIAKGVMLRSLEQLGAAIDEFLDRNVLLQECQKLLKKGIPAALDWFPFTALPTVHWQDTGEPVAPDILQGLIVQSFQRKSLEPGAMLQRHVELWQPQERGAFGQFVLEHWIAHDIRPQYTPEEADQAARAQAQQQHQGWQQLYQQYQATPNQAPSNPIPTYDELYRQNYRELIETCAGSAMKEKGILAIAAACCGGEAAPPVYAYLKKWHNSRRTNQCKALLQVLAQIDDDRAIQVLLTVANRFRSKGIQKEANQRVKTLVEQQGWSRDELSDRTIPTAGFDAGVAQTLDYGDRQFTLLLNDDLKLVLKNGDGKVLKSLPTARKDEDPDQVKAAKKQFSEAKKQLKEVLKTQQERLYEAMCVQRAWRFQDWDTYLNRHPIVGRYCQQLVWAVYDSGDHGEPLVQTLRPLEDGTLTDVHDEKVNPDLEAIVRIAHTRTLADEDIAAWQAHLADYDVPPLFPQFPPNPYRLPADHQEETALRDFEGYVTSAFKLRNLLANRGYFRGVVEECRFYDYRKTLTNAGIEIVVGFSGNVIPEEDIASALTTVSFNRLSDVGATQGGGRSPLRLGEVGPVLLSEVWSELQAIAAQTDGYDPDWFSKTGY